MQQDKSEVIFDPHQVFPLPFTLIANVRKALTSIPLKQPFAYEVYCPISCKKIRIGVATDKNHSEAMEFNTTSSRWISAEVNGDIKYLVNGNNPTKKDKKKAAGQNLSIYLDVQDKGNIAIFNPFYIDPKKPLSLYTFSTIVKAFKPVKEFEFTEKLAQRDHVKRIQLNNKTYFLCEQRIGSFISQSGHFEDIFDNCVTIVDPSNPQRTYRDKAKDIKQLVNTHLNYWLDQLQQHYIAEHTGTSKILEHNIDVIYQKLSFYLNIDEQLRIKLLSNKSKDLIKELYDYHPRVYSALNRLCSFINYGNTKFDVFKLADLGFFNKTDMLQDLAFIQNPQVAIPTAEQNVNEKEDQLRSRAFPFSRLNRQLPFPNVSLDTCLNAISPQTVSSQEILITQISDPYVIFVDKNKKITSWSGRSIPIKLFEVDLLKQQNINAEHHKVITIEKQIKVQQVEVALNSSQHNDLLGDMFNEEEPKNQAQSKPVPIVPDLDMVEQLLSMGYQLNLVQQALKNVKNESVAVALDEIQKLKATQQKKSKKKPKPTKEWSCQICTYINGPQKTICEMCAAEAEVIDEQQVQEKLKQQEQKRKKEQEIKLQLQKKKSQEQRKKLQEQENKKKQLESKKEKQDLLRNAQITYAKLFRSKHSSINPFILVVLLVDKHSNRSILKIIRIGYNRTLLTQFYRYENNSFVSNFNRNVYQEKQKSIEPLNKIISESWTQIQVVNRFIHPYRSEEYFVLEEKDIVFELVVQSVKCDGQNLQVNLNDDKSKKYKFQFNDDLLKSTFYVIQDESANVQLPVQSQKIVQVLSSSESSKKLIRAQSKSNITITTSNCTTSALIQVVEHLPAGKWKGLPKYSNNYSSSDSKTQSEVVMSEFLPLMIESYEGSIFSSKYQSTSLFERNNLYISNYPQANFTFKSTTGKNILAETVTVVSHNKRLQKIYPIESGLIFTANEASWFDIAKQRFSNFTRKHYDEWLNSKKDRNGYREFWEPVAFFELQSQTQVEIDFKRPAKYIYFLPTSVRTHSQKADVAALKIDFFGVKGRIEEFDEEQHAIFNFKDDCTGHNTLSIEGQNNLQSIVVRKRSGINTMNFIPTNYQAFEDLPVSVSTVYELKFKTLAERSIKIQSPYLHQTIVQMHSHTQQPLSQQELQISSYKNLLENYNNLTEEHILNAVQKLDMKELLVSILSNTKSFRIFDKILKIVDELEPIKNRLFQAMANLLPKLCDDEYEVNQYGLKTFLRIFQKIAPADNYQTFKSLSDCWANITEYVKKIRNKNYNVIRNNYAIEELILEPQLFSRDYYRLIYPNYIEEEPVSTIIQQPKTELNNAYYVEKQNHWYFKTLIDLKEVKNVQKLQLYFPKILQSANRFKLGIRLFSISDQGQKLVYFRNFNEQMLYQFATIAFKDKEIYSQPRINFFTIDVNTQTRFFRLQYNYLLLTTLNSIRYKEPTESLMLYPVFKTTKVENLEQKPSTQILKQIESIYPKQTKHSSITQNIPPVKYATDRAFSFYEIYEFPVVNHEHVSKQFTSLIDKVATNIMDKKIIDECMKNMKISQYQFNQKGLDFGYTFLIKVLKLFKKMPVDAKVQVSLLLEIFDVFVVYEIGPIMKKVMGFIGEVYKRLDVEEKINFISQIIIKYLSSFTQFKELKESEKYSLTKVIEKLQELQLPAGLLMDQLSDAYTTNNRFLMSMLLKLIKPNLEKFGINETLLKKIENSNYKSSIITLKQMISTTFKFNLWVLHNVESLKVELLSEGLDLLLTFMDGKQDFIEKNKSQSTKAFINSVEEEDIWKLVFLTLKIKNQNLNKKVHEVFQILMQNTTQKFKKSINTMLLEIIKKQQDSTYTRINGEVNDDLWMNHLQTILEYIDIDSKVDNEPQINQNADQKQKKKEFSLDIDTAIELLNLPLTPVLWSHALLIIPKEDKVLNAIIKNFKKEYYSSLGKEITKLCEPLAGIRSLESTHINWLDLVRKIRLENRSVFSLFVEELRKSSYGGREGVSMATQQDVKQLEITSQFLKLVLEKDLSVNELDQEAISEILVWYFLNNTDAKGQSPASDFLKIISQNLLKFIRKLAQHSQLVPTCIKSILQIKKDSEKMEGMFQENRLPTHSALSLSKRFCKCFEDLIAIFVSNDKMSHYFAFDINGLEYIMEKLNLFKNSNLKTLSKSQVSAEKYLPQEQFLLNEKILSKKVQASSSQTEIKMVEDMIGQQFATNVKLVASMNQTASTTSVDWTVYKKGNKTKIIFLPMNDPATYFEYPLYVELGKTAQVRSIKIGFPCSSFEFTDKLVVSPSAVVIEGSVDMKSFEPLGEMTYIDDDGYLCNGVKVFALNLQKVKKSTKIDQAIKGIEVKRIKYLKIVVKRPLVTFIEGQYSQINGKPYNNLGVSISFLSVLGDDIAKIPNQLVDSCKEMSKKTALSILSSLMTESNLQTMKKISNEETFSSKVKQNFHQLKQLMYKYKQIVPQIIYTVGSNNKQLGDWLIEHFIKSAKEEVQAKIINQIIVSTPSKIYERINYFQRQLFKQFAIIRSQSEVEASLLYSKYVPFMQSFCKTLQECYEIDFKNNSQTELVLDCDQTRIDYLIDIYDKKHSSPDIKSLLKLLIAFIWIKKPLKLSEQVIFNTLDLIWKNCSQAKPYFYNIMSALLVSKISMTWISKDDHAKVKSLINEIEDSLAKENYKALRSQMFLLSILSYHEAEYLRFIDYHIKIYNALKIKTFPDSDIYDHLMKILQNVVLEYPQQEEKLAALLIQDVTLLVKRKDPALQKLFVGLLGVEQQVMIHLKGLSLLSINSNKKKNLEGVPSKILTRQQQKALGQKFGKKLKYHQAYYTQHQITQPDMTTIGQCLYTASTLVIIKVKHESKTYNIGVYCPVKPTKRQDDSYSEQIQVTADTNCFIFSYFENQHTYLACDSGTKVMSHYSCAQEEDFSLTLHHNGKQLARIHPDNTTMEVKGDLLFKKDKINYSTVQILGIEIFECKISTSASSSDSKIAQLLSKSNQAKAPFTWYRHNQIYIFPSEITISKLQKLLSAKISIENITEINPNTKLKEIQNEDFIIDVTIENPDDYSGQQDFGYIPKMNIFNSFSKLDGINEVLRLGSQSIKDWKNAARKKSFEHYMDELKSFIHLPNFFSLFIKNHTYVTFLFEVAAGMPDDSTSTRNWQEEQVNSSRFIYKILSDIFKFDRSKQLRDMNKYEDFCEIILEKLSEIAKEAPRVYKQDEILVEKEEQVQVADKLEKKKTEQKKIRKKKGTGYGADNINSSKWSSAEWLQNKKMRSQQTLRVVSIFVSFLDCEVPIEDQRLPQVIKSSCLMPLIQSALRSSSLLEIAKEIDLFKCYLSIVKNLAKNPSTIGCLLDIEKNYKPQQTESIHSLLGKLNNISEIFLECLKSGKQSNAENQNTESLATQIQKTFQFIDKAVKSLSKGKNVMTIKQINELPIQNAYRILLQKLRFGYIDMKKGAAYQHCLHASISSSSPSTQKILRLSQELADLSSSLPCEHTNSIFVRCDKSRIDLIKILIMGSKDTPYSNGAFMFDLYCDDSYPNNPPKMVIATTGQGKIRFNPNLYSCGKVCLSLLGTWRGSASENWDPKLSTLLQLFISTQGITMSDDVYFNEPGFDGEQGTQEGQKKNEAYSNVVRLGNVRYAMIEQIKNPPKGFEDVIQRHFYVKKKEILEQCDKWLQWAEKRQASYTGLVSDHNSSWCTQLKVTKTKYKQLLEKDIQTLRQVLEQIPEPDLMDKNEEEATFSKIEKKKRKAKQAELEIDVAYDTEKKEQLKIEEDVMQDRWSRYIGAMGLEAVKKQSSSNVLLVGLKSLGLQIAKNLILSGLQKLTIVQDSILDSGAQQHFYMTDLKGKKIQQCIFKLKELNPYMIVNHLEKLPQTLKDYHLVVSTLSIDVSKDIAQKCRNENVKFVYSETCGVAGSYFADFGQNFTINDTNGEQPFEGLIEKITCEKQGVVKLLDGVKHPYSDGDYVVINKVEGMQIINESIEQPSQAQQFYGKMISTQATNKLNSINGHVFQIKVINWNSFSIGDTTNFKPYVRNGIVKNIKVPKSVKFESFDSCLKDFNKFVDPNMGIYDFEKMGDNFAIFACFIALSKFELKNKTKPQNWNQAHCKEFLEIVKQVSEQYKKSEQQTKHILQFATKFSLISQAELPTIGAYLGGVVSQQIIKGLTNKYTPINQFFVFHLNELIQKVPEQQNKWTDLTVKKEEPFRNIKIVVGQQSMNKIQNMKLFIVGAGAIGCELLKNFAMVNMGSKGKITVTDPDHIETSNLTRQFLFRQKHVKKPKSATASAVLIQMNPNLKNHISARLDKVCQQTEDIYSDEFFKSQTVVANALDNVKARQYMDKRCVVNKIPLFESGTLGPKGHVQVIVPYKTQNYGSQADPQEEAQIPHCTLKMFPEDITHCIQWSRDIFGKIFTLNPKALKKVIDSKDTTSLQGKQKSTVLKMIKFRPKTFEDCIDQAVRIFFKYFRNDIRQLLYTYPLDMKTKEGKLFWTLPKRPPIQISQLDAKDESHQTFISSYAVLFAKTFSIDYPKDFRKPEGKAKIMEHAVNVKVQDFVPSAQKSKQIQEMTEKQEKTKQKMSEGTQKLQIQQPLPIVQEQIKITPQILELSIKPEQFEKDEDSNGHIDLIYSMSNLRARNYDLGECKWIDAKLKAGRIMAALSTTTSVVAAIQTLQIIKLVIGSEVWRNAFVNLAVPLVQISEPGPAVKQKLGNTEFSVWQDWEFKATSLKDLLTQIKQKYEIEGFNISTSQGTPIFWQAMYKDKQQAQQTLLNKKLSLLIGKEKTTLNILFRDLKSQTIYQKVPKIIVYASE